MIFHHLRLAARRFGLEVQRANIMSLDDRRLASFLRLAGVTQVLDVGANKGQFAREVFDAGFQGRVVSFEPLPDAHAALREAAKGSPLWTVAPAVALSDGDGVEQFNVSANSVSSSLLTMERLHTEASPGSQTVSTIEVPTRRLDTMWQDLELGDAATFLKIDTQGSEARVLDGAAGVMDRIVGVKLEMSLASLYAGQPLLMQLFEWLQYAGFECWDIVPGFRHSRTARLFQCDGVFFRPGVSP